MTLAEAIQQASIRAARFRLHDYSDEARDARGKRDELIRHAYRHGAPIRELCLVAGISSTSTLHGIVRSVRNTERHSVLDTDWPVAA